MTKNAWFLTSLFFMLSLSINAQDDERKESDLKVTLDLNNPTREINDGVTMVNVEGGKAPYTYKWTKQSTSLQSNKSTGITEGQEVLPKSLKYLLKRSQKWLIVKCSRQ